jgi:SPP1 gp7 family putative phage head morphogenesis protein
MELYYKLWLRELFKSFDSALMNEALKALETKSQLNEKFLFEFLNRVNYDPITKVFNQSLSETQRYLEELIKETSKPKRGKKTPVKTKEDYEKERMLVKTKYSDFDSKIQERKGGFETAEKEFIKYKYAEIFETRKSQLKNFQDSFLFNNLEKKKIFQEKYKQPKYNFTETHSRTEINNLNRDLNSTLATNVGIEKCRWSTSLDERVRETHKLLEGKIFRYDDLPKEYNDYNCRCVLIPIIEISEEDNK